MEHELDHVFIYTTPGAPEAQALIDFGLVEGSSRVHTAQGTTNRRFFFHNAMLELLYVRDEAEAAQTTGASIRVLERSRWQKGSGSPFGVCFRPSRPDVSHAPFDAWAYQPPYLPEHMHIGVARNIDVLSEPMLFHLAFGERPDAMQTPPPFHHPAGMKEVTALRIYGPWETLSADMQSVSQVGGVRFLKGDTHRMELEFDHHGLGLHHDFAPILPMSFFW